MRILALALWLILFVVLFGFAVSNTAPAELHLYGVVWQAPLIALLLVFFIVGVAFGFLAMLPTWFRLRMELRRLRKARRDAQSTTAPNASPAIAAPDSIQSVAQGARTTS
ncbi:MAG: LapA family protein [Burkholderiaceae bacterium]|jgi:putative membrane protein